MPLPSSLFDETGVAAGWFDGGTFDRELIFTSDPPDPPDPPTGISGWLGVTWGGADQYNFQVRRARHPILAYVGGAWTIAEGAWVRGQK